MKTLSETTKTTIIFWIFILLYVFVLILIFSIPKHHVQDRSPHEEASKANETLLREISDKLDRLEEIERYTRDTSIDINEMRKKLFRMKLIKKT
jgi:uncharacterized membrane protein